MLDFDMRTLAQSFWNWNSPGKDAVYFGTYVIDEKME